MLQLHILSIAKQKYEMEIKERDVLEDIIEELHFELNKIHGKNKRKEKLVDQKNNVTFK